ncbi:glycosyltransferase family 1 protein [Methanofollis formosanus]|uniref:Glycosyltransferase family 1 protein n=1 Tax=Methanofollis formosanus TaxID=299308 RepID=A0A8G1A3F5_9EURY|nr:glycosyltransferase family 4 protein [Methanofollis formosanus]QYZ79855.1 glycosyltransferase family 1 protein [Methanofollis formosanus]
MKILRVVSDLYPSVVGGIGLHAHEMSHLQARNGHDVTVMTFRTDTSQFLIEKRDGYRLVRSDAPFQIFGNTISFSLFFQLLRCWNSYDIVHAHSHMFFSTLLCALARKFRKSPLVVTNHGLVSQTAPGWLQRFYIPTMGKWVFQSADAIICYTEIERSQVIDLGVSPSRIHVIHNGIDTDVFVPSASCNPKKQILWIGRFAPGKGVEYLLKGFQIFAREHPDYTLMMVGSGPLRDKFIKSIREGGLEDKIVLREFVPNDELLGLYHDSCLFVLSSLEEGVPRTILEAMACARPVVCTELPQLIDVVGRCGILIPLKNSEALAGALSKIVCNPRIARALGNSGRNNVVSRYSWDDTVCKTLRLYESLVRSCSPGDQISEVRNPREDQEKRPGSHDSERIGCHRELAPYQSRGERR